MKIEINKLSPEKIDVKFLKKFAERAFKIVKLKKFSELSLVLVCDARMKALNKKYKKRNRTTDVLAFDYGEIIICLPQAKRQAKELSHSLKEELGILLVHGILHLLGYDDRTKADFNKMTKKQKGVWEKIKS